MRWRVNPESPPTDLRVTFAAEGDGTRVELIHTGWEAYGDGGARAERQLQRGLGHGARPLHRASADAAEDGDRKAGTAGSDPSVPVAKIRRRCLATGPYASRCWARPSSVPRPPAPPRPVPAPSSAGSLWACLVLLSLVLITLSFRVERARRRAGHRRRRPAAVRGRRQPRRRGRSATRPAGRTASSTRNRRTRKLRRQIESLRQQVYVDESALQENVALKQQLNYHGPPTIADFDRVSAAVLTEPPSPSDQSITIAAGSANQRRGRRRGDHAGRRSSARSTRVFAHVSRVMLLTDEQSAVHGDRPDDPDARSASFSAATAPAAVLAIDRVSKAKHVGVGDTIITNGTLGGGPAALDVPARHPDRDGRERGDQRHQPVPEHPGAAVRRLHVAAGRDRARAEALMDGLQAALVLFVASLVQVSVLGGVLARSARPASSSSPCSRSRCSAARSSARSPASATGLLLDTATLGTLGFTSLLLTVAGFWIGRYGETTARDRFHAPYLSVAVVTVLYAYGQTRAPLRARRAGAGRRSSPRELPRRSARSTCC